MFVLLAYSTSATLAIACITLLAASALVAVVGTRIVRSKEWRQVRQARPKQQERNWRPARKAPPKNCD